MRAAGATPPLAAAAWAICLLPDPSFSCILLGPAWELTPVACRPFFLNALAHIEPLDAVHPDLFALFLVVVKPALLWFFSEFAWIVFAGAGCSVLPLRAVIYNPLVSARFGFEVIVTALIESIES